MSQLPPEPDPSVDALLPIVYGELHRLAESLMAKERDDHTLQPTALVNEVYLRMADESSVQFHDRAHFYRTASRAMRRILVDHARRKKREKRGGGQSPKALPWPDHVARDGSPSDLVALDDALNRLSQRDRHLGEIVELRFFCGLNHPEIAEITQKSLRSIERSWALARAWLNRELDGDEPVEP